MTSGYTPEQLASRATAKVRFKEKNPRYHADWRAKHPGYMVKWRAKNPRSVSALDSTGLTLFFAWLLMRPEREKARALKWARSHPEERKIIRKRWAEKNPEKISAIRSARGRVRRATDPNWKLQKTYRDQIYHALKGSRKSAKGKELLGCSFEFFREYIEKQFSPAMTWANHGTVWELDHILPCAEFHLQHSEEQEICFHWTNFQPLLVADNRTKGDKIL